MVTTQDYGWACDSYKTRYRKRDAGVPQAIFMSLITPGGSGDTAWLVDISDSLVISGASSQTGEKLTCNFRFVQVDASGCFAKIWADSRTLDLSAGDRSVKSVTYLFDQQFFSGPNSQTYLSDISIEAAVATTRGQTFARVNLFRKSNNAKSTKCAILSDYVTTQVTACLRNARHFTSTEGQGWAHGISIGILGANTEVLLTVPTNARWKIKCFNASLNNDANAGNRQASFTISTPILAIWTVLIITGQPASVHNIVNLANGNNSGLPVGTGTFGITNFSFNTAPLPADLVLVGGDFLTTRTTFVGAGDVWGNGALEVEEWIDNV